MTYDASEYERQPQAIQPEPVPCVPFTEAAAPYVPQPPQAPVYMPAPGDQNPRYGIDESFPQGATHAQVQSNPYGLTGPAFAPNPAYGAVAGPPPSVRLPVNVSAPGFTSAATPLWPYAFIALAVLGAIGLVLPWFRPFIVGYESDAATPLHSWNGWIFFFAPFGMIACALTALKARSNPTQLQALPRLALLTGVIFTVVLVIHWFGVPTQYKDWDSVNSQAKSLGLSISYGPQLGYWLSAVVAAGYLGVGIFLLIRSRNRIL